MNLPTNEDESFMGKLLGRKLSTKSGGYMILKGLSGTDEQLATEIGKVYRSKEAIDDSMELAMFDVRNQKQVPQFRLANFEMLVRLTASDALEWFDRLETAFISTNRAFASIEVDRYTFQSIQHGETSTKITCSEGKELAKNFINACRGLRKRYGPLDIIFDDTNGEGKNLIQDFFAQNNLSSDDWIMWHWEGCLQSIFEFFEPPSEMERFSSFHEYPAYMMEIASAWLPRTWGAFFEHCISTKRLNNMEIAAIREMLKGRKIDLKELEKDPGELDRLSSIIRPN